MMSVQDAALASQNITSPGETAFDPAVTVAVRVTVPPHTRVVTLLPPEVSVRDVAVAVCAAASDETPPTMAASMQTAMSRFAAADVLFHEIEKISKGPKAKVFQKFVKGACFFIAP